MAAKFNKVHQVAARDLRPRWLWAADAHAWRFELLCGHGCVPLEADAATPGMRPTFVFAKGRR